MTHATRALQSHDLSGDGIKLWITYILFWPHKDMEGLPGWLISPMPGPPLRQHKHERQYTPSTHSVTRTGRIWNDDDDGQMIFGDLGGLKFPDICLTGEENPEKTSPRKHVPTGDRTRARCGTSAHATTCSTAVDITITIIMDDTNWKIRNKAKINITEKIIYFHSAIHYICNVLTINYSAETCCGWFCK